MTNYIDGFAFPIQRVHLDEYKQVAEKVAEIWKEYGALSYNEFIGDDLHLEGTKSFIETLDAADGEVIVFGWVVFPSKEIRDLSMKKVPEDHRVAELVAKLTHPENGIFRPDRMVYGGFKPLIQVGG
jgi:uncharacterized protein YbaA (DUF1428 family)